MLVSDLTGTGCLRGSACALKCLHRVPPHIGARSLCQDLLQLKSKSALQAMALMMSGGKLPRQAALEALL